MSAFEQNLRQGAIGESLIVRWLLARGRAVMPAYEKLIDTGKGPQLLAPSGEYVAPDLLVIRLVDSNGEPFTWVEAKHKSHFTWHRNSHRWTTGIDRRHYQNYLKVEEITRVPVWLMFYHSSPNPSPSDLAAGCPRQCPTGLFGNRLAYLANHVSHESDRYGRSGMVYWAHEQLRLMAAMEALRALGGEVRQ